MDDVMRALYGSAAAHARGDVQAVGVLLDSPALELGLDQVVIVGVGALVEILDDVAQTRGVRCSEYARELLLGMTSIESTTWLLLSMVCAASDDDLEKVAAGLDGVCSEPDVLTELAGMLALFLAWQAHDRDVPAAEWIRGYCHTAALLDEAA